MANIQQLYDLHGKVSVVTGGASGIGLQMASGLAEAGSNLVICARNVERCEEAAHHLSKLGVDVFPLRCDVTQEEEVSAMKDKIIKCFGKIDVLVNNAGRAWISPPEEIPLDRWNQVMNLNVNGTFLCSQILGRTMIEQEKGKIINIASVSGLVGKNPEVHNSLVYNTSKGAVVNFTRDLAVKWARYNIHVNAIAPGFFPTPLNEKMYEMKKDLILREIPLRRVGGENDLKGPVVFLASDASNFVTGAILSVDGGAVAW